MCVPCCWSPFTGCCACVCVYGLALMLLRMVFSSLLSLYFCPSSNILTFAYTGYVIKFFAFASFVSFLPFFLSFFSVCVCVRAVSASWFIWFDAEKIFFSPSKHYYYYFASFFLFRPFFLFNFSALLRFQSKWNHFVLNFQPSFRSSYFFFSISLSLFFRHYVYAYVSSSSRKEERRELAIWQFHKETFWHFSCSLSFSLCK